MIISVSRRTDIPAYYTPWFINRLAAGEVFVRNPYRPHQVSRIPLTEDTIDGFVFWSKNPAPLLPHLSKLIKYPFYIQYTLTPYGKDIEPHLPDKWTTALHNFKVFSAQLSSKQLVWRYDPILLSGRYTPAFHLNAFEKLCASLSGKTDLCILSFLDAYPSIQPALKKHGIQTVPRSMQMELLSHFSAISNQYGISLAACAEDSELPVTKSSCIDHHRLATISGKTYVVPKAKGQRPNCGCCESIDIGSYRTCPGNCIYCYANQGKVPSPHSAHNPDSPLLFGSLTEADTLTNRDMPLFQTNQIPMF